MNDKRKKGLTKLRQEIAIQLCIQYPHLYSQITSHVPMFVTEKEALEGQVLRELLKLEPSIGHILHYYTRQEGC